MLAELDSTVVDVQTDASRLRVTLADGRKLSVPLELFTRLRDATPEQRKNWRPIGRGQGIHWPDVDEDVSVARLLGTRIPSQSAAPNQPTADTSSEILPLAASIIREFFVDFLSSLVPGFLFTMFAVPPAILTLMFLSPSLPQIKAALSVSREMFSTEIWCLTLVVSYVLGCVFSKRDPKVPDKKSVAYILWKDWSSRDRAVVRGKDIPEVKKESGINSYIAVQFPRLYQYLLAKRLAEGDGAQFPYSHLYEYLMARGLRYLALRVPWHGEDETINPRSKMFINILKIRLQYSTQRQFGDIIRNEAHIRMMSSVWYAALQLQKVYLILLSSFLMLSWYFHLAKTPGFRTVLVLLIALLLAALWLRRMIITFLHYQRVREIVYVLETAHTSWMNGNDTIFDGLEYSPPPSKHGEPSHRAEQDPKT